MKKVNLDWENLGFSYQETDYRYVSIYKDGAWGEGELTKDPNIPINESAAVLQYAQTIFEGLKAYETKNGDIVTFRTDLNAKRFQDSARRLEMPPISEEMFLEGVAKAVEANVAYVPPYGSGAALYVRPFMFGAAPVIGITPATEYQFRVYTTPVGPYFKGGVKPISLCVADFDRAAPRGTGHVKAGLNYAMGMHPTVTARKKGFADNIYLDSTTRTKVEETSGANFLFVTKDKKVITPSSPTILPSITRRSLQHVAKEYLGLEIEEREVYLEELEDFVECGVCGTAAVIAPVGKIVDKDKEILFPSGMEEMGEITKKLYDTLVGIQYGTIDAPEGWIRKVIGKNDTK
jgi:branched-chain amino acid aminotransferase